MQNKNFKKNNIVRRSNRRRRIPRPRKFLLSYYPNKTNPATFGPGVYNLAVTKLIYGQLDTQVFYTAYYDFIQNNPEFLRIESDFKYVKIKGISITFYTRNIPTTNGNETPCYLLVNFDGQATENIRLQDNVKVVPPYLTKNKIFKFKIPNINTQGGMLNKWFSLQDIAYWDDIGIQIVAPDNTTKWYIRIDIHLVFRGPTNITAKQVELVRDLYGVDDMREANSVRKALPSITKGRKILKKREVIEDKKKEEDRKKYKSEEKDQ